MPRFPAFFCGFQGVRRRPINPLLAFPQTKPASSGTKDAERGVSAASPNFRIGVFTLSIYKGACAVKTPGDRTSSGLGKSLIYKHI